MGSKISQQDLTLIVAKLIAKYGAQINQAKLAVRLGTSQPTISRAIASAKAQNLLIEAYRFSGELSPTAEAVVAQFERNVPALLTALQGLEIDQDEIALHEIEVLDNSLVPDDGQSETDHNQFGAGVGAVLTRWLSGADKIGVTWGGGVFHATKNIDFEHFDGSAPVFYPTCGNLRTGRGQYTSTAIADSVNERAGTDRGLFRANALGLNAFIPFEYASDDDERVKFAEIMLESSAAYRNVLGGYLNRPDEYPAGVFGTVVTGAGQDGAPFGHNLQDFLKIVTPRGPDLTARIAVNHEKIKRWFVGEFAGNLLLSGEKLTPEEQREARVMQDIWTGIRLKNIRIIAQRANGRTRKGVIALGSGAERAKTLLQAIRFGLVSRLVIDRALFDALNHLATTAR
ncbi:MAG: hypothetical protein ABJQ34_14355 [Paracoccaceae bacterium]